MVRSIIHRFRDITTFTVYVTACELEKSFNFDTTVETVTRHIPFSDSHAREHNVANTCYICRGIRVRKVLDC